MSCACSHIWGSAPCPATASSRRSQPHAQPRAVLTRGSRAVEASALPLAGLPVLIYNGESPCALAGAQLGMARRGLPRARDTGPGAWPAPLHTRSPLSGGAFARHGNGPQPEHRGGLREVGERETRHLLSGKLISLPGTARGCTHAGSLGPGLGLGSSSWALSSPHRGVGGLVLPHCSPSAASSRSVHGAGCISRPWWPPCVDAVALLPSRAAGPAPGCSLLPRLLQSSLAGARGSSDKELPGGRSTRGCLGSLARVPWC